ncbi:autotransporter assembly complex protein TamA [Seohaeicola zhoushanensis]|uniref:Outer membrane protein assembly factor n=1 Tax=Seohaeicola zhoushanensis TaxID=1569283 RepID=A0A8J3H1X6_9RHOB|nr:BamA/TamA family outer membrane protein [Seohaeicola zhoushanensis]GHF66811.1 outer membrane protein assembly factor [Seohaeicola zhoushanensis]
MGPRGWLAAVVLLMLPLSAQALEAALTAPGAPDDVTARLRASSAVLAAKGSGLTSGQEIYAAALSDYRTLVQVMYDAGYFSPVVSIRLDGREAAEISTISPPTRVANIAVSVEPGRPFRFRTAQIAPLAPGTELPASFAPGRPASTGIIRDAGFAAKDGWRRAGYAKVTVGSQRIVARHPTAEIDADIRLLPGRQLRFGKLYVTGEDRVREAAILRIAGIPTGEVYDPEMVQRLGARLRRTGAFKSVSIVEAPVANADGTLDFTVEVEEQLPRRITFGAEVQSRSGVNLSAVWIHRNLFGNAERLRLEADIRNIGGDQPIDGLIAVRLDNPARLGRDNNVFFLAELERIERLHYNMDRFMLGVGIRRTKSAQLFGEASLTLSTARASDAFGDRDFNLLSLPLHVQLDKRDSSTNATRGYFLDGTVTPFTGFGQSASGVAAKLDARAYLSLSESGSIVLAGRLQLGSVAGASLSEISPDLLFYSGGAGTVRGHPYQSLGVPVGTDTAGGRSMLVANAEIRARVTEKIGLVAFFDYGAVDSSAFVSSVTASHSGAGIGLRYDIGAFGPIRFDIAAPVSGSTDDGLQFYLGIGQSF